LSSAIDKLINISNIQKKSNFLYSFHIKEKNDTRENENENEKEKVRIILLLFHHHWDRQEQLLNRASVLMLFPAIKKVVVDEVTCSYGASITNAFYI